MTFDSNLLLASVMIKSLGDAPSDGDELFFGRPVLLGLPAARDGSCGTSKC